MNMLGNLRTSENWCREISSLICRHLFLLFQSVFKKGTSQRKTQHPVDYLVALPTRSAVTTPTSAGIKIFLGVAPCRGS